MYLTKAPDAGKKYAPKDRLGTMIGYYNVSVILTYIGLISSALGIFLASSGKVAFPLVCLVISGVCDMFDGKIARMTKRSAEAKHFGIEIDSLSDLVCFGVFPASMAVSFGVKGVFGYMVMCLYVLAAVIRLGFFNVDEFLRQKTTDENRDWYRGLPVTTIALVFPLVSIMRLFEMKAYPVVITVVMLAMALLFVLDIRIKKIHI